MDDLEEDSDFGILETKLKNRSGIEQTKALDDDDDEKSQGEFFDDDDDNAPEEDRDELKEVQKLAQRETRNMWCWRLILLSCMIVAAAVVTTVTYRSLQEDRDQEFETAYQLFVSGIESQLGFQRSNIGLILKGMADSISGKASAYGDTWPNVVVPDFEMIGQGARAKGSGIVLTTWSPIVVPQAVDSWLNFSTTEAPRWLAEGRATAVANQFSKVQSSNFDTDQHASPILFTGDLTADPLQPATGAAGFFTPVWQISPPPFDARILNFDFTSLDAILQAAVALVTLQKTIFSGVFDLRFFGLNVLFDPDHTVFHHEIANWILPGDGSTYWDHPHCLMVEPLYKEKNNYASDIVGVVVAAVSWDAYLVDLLPDGVRGLTIIMENTCGQLFTFEINGAEPYYMGEGDMHDTAYDKYKVSIPFYGWDDPDAAAAVDGHCLYTFHVYPSKELEDEYRLDVPIIIVIAVAGAFAFMILSFFVYDWFVGSRNRKVLNAAATSNAIVSNMFPAQIREELLSRQKQEQAQKKKRTSTEFYGPGKSHQDGDLMKDMATADTNDQGPTTPAIADFYPDTSIMFGDIVGFTAWSSVREPVQVFELLEEVYESFDKIAKQRRIFKVETVGDCYVAATGLPTPRDDHAVALARFARDCMFRMQNIARKLEIRLGPETADLTMRIGIHSGSVTAGVLRGERTRFQLFGDTMNTASRMESKGMPNRIQISSDTAELLKKAGKEKWITAREEMIDVKGKGMMQTYWLKASGSGTDTNSSNSSTEDMTDTSGTDYSDSWRRDSTSGYTPARDGVEWFAEEKSDSRKKRLVKWNVEVMSNILRKIEAYRTGHGEESASNRSPPSSPESYVLDEVKEVIGMPAIRAVEAKAETITLKDEVVEQLETYVTAIAAAYRDNAFHDFEHACHVSMATAKMLSMDGLTSDPITEFACMFSSLVHDVDHFGVPNSTLVKEKTAEAIAYKQSILEQNSFNLAWDLLMKNEFEALRTAICKGPEELRRFRQVVINMVMATDIMDKELNELRKQRWEKAFGGDVNATETAKDQSDRKATIVLEHMIQAADVAHTMQHWHIYHKWNKRLFMEMYTAYIQGRSETDPSTFWYQGELQFFDFYIIPLAKKLSDCGVFGVSSEEYLDYAERNRTEWEKKGELVVAEYLEEARGSSLVVAEEAHGSSE